MKKVSPLFLLLILATRISTAQSVQRVTVNFDFNEYNLTSQAKAGIDSLALFTKSQQSRVEKIEIAGHCDSVGNDAYNDNLSKERADAVEQYLLAKGISAATITQEIGYGKRKPIISNSSEAGRGANRRVEIVIYWKPEPATQPQAHLDTVNGTIDLSKVGVNENLVLENINFYPSSHHVIPQSIPTLKMLVNTMLENKTLRIEVQGHICCNKDSAEDGYDEITETNTLSVERAKAIRGYLVAHGVEPERVEARGFGGKRPLVKEYTEADQQKNRRVEIKILSK